MLRVCGLPRIALALGCAHLEGNCEGEEMFVAERGRMVSRGRREE